VIMVGAELVATYRISTARNILNSCNDAEQGTQTDK